MAKGIYVGGSFSTTSEPQEVVIDSSNISQYFTVINGDYCFAPYSVGSSQFTTNNQGIGGSTAETTLIALRTISTISFKYSYSSEEGYDKFTLIVKGNTIVDEASGAYTEDSYSGWLAPGDSITFKYTKDGSVDGNDDTCDFWYMRVYASATTTTDNVARQVAQPYIGIDNVARKVSHGHIGIENVARRFLGEEVPIITWQKHSCTYSSSTTYTPATTSAPSPTTHQVTYIQNQTYKFGRSYSFSGSTRGYALSSTSSLKIPASLTKSTLASYSVGKYIIGSPSSAWQYVFKINSIQSFSTSTVGSSLVARVTYKVTKAAAAAVSQAGYQKGDYIEDVQAKEGELPGNGTLKSGSVSGTYCILEENGTYYYYTRV